MVGVRPLCSAFTRLTILPPLDNLRKTPFYIVAQSGDPLHTAEIDARPAAQLRAISADTRLPVSRMIDNCVTAKPYSGCGNPGISEAEERVTPALALRIAGRRLWLGEQVPAGGYNVVETGVPGAHLLLPAKPLGPGAVIPRHFHLGARLQAFENSVSGYDRALRRLQNAIQVLQGEIEGDQSCAVADRRGDYINSGVVNTRHD